MTQWRLKVLVYAEILFTAILLIIAAMIRMR